jgi:hypothetical protein
MEHAWLLQNSERHQAGRSTYLTFPPFLVLVLTGRGEVGAAVHG